MALRHKHHITPRHAGGSNNPENIVELTVTQHAMYHFANWQFWDRKEDWLAWRGLAGICTKEELVDNLMQLGRDKGKPNREAAVKAMFEEGTHPFLSSSLIEKRRPVNARCIAEYNRSSEGRLKSKETVTRTNLRRDKCPHCDFVSNPGNLAKHIRQSHKNG
jgi:hypothetical protein